MFLEEKRRIVGARIRSVRNPEKQLSQGREAHSTMAELEHGGKKRFERDLSGRRKTFCASYLLARQKKHNALAVLITKI